MNSVLVKRNNEQAIVPERPLYVAVDFVVQPGVAVAHGVGWPLVHRIFFRRVDPGNGRQQIEIGAGVIGERTMYRDRQRV